MADLAEPQVKAMHQVGRVELIPQVNLTPQNASKCIIDDPTGSRKCDQTAKPRQTGALAGMTDALSPIAISHLAESSRAWSHNGLAAPCYSRKSVRSLLFRQGAAALECVWR